MYRVFLGLAILLSTALAWGQDNPASDSTTEETIYVPLKPSFVVNYGGQGRLKYLKVDMSVRVADAVTANAIRHHLPYIRNNLVMLFASQTDASIESQAGKEALRQEALAEVKAILQAEDGHEAVVDIYFDNFVIQR